MGLFYFWRNVMAMISVPIAIESDHLEIIWDDIKDGVMGANDALVMLSVVCFLSHIRENEEITATKISEKIGFSKEYVMELYSYLKSKRIL
jgi:hypothetical protein